MNNEDLTQSAIARGRQTVLFKDMKKGILIRKQGSRGPSTDFVSVDSATRKLDSPNHNEKKTLKKNLSMVKLRSSFSFFGRKNKQEDTPQASTDDRDDSQEPKRKKNVTFANKIDDKTPKPDKSELEFSGFGAAIGGRKKQNFVAKKWPDNSGLNLEN